MDLVSHLENFMARILRRFALGTFRFKVNLSRVMTSLETTLLLILLGISSLGCDAKRSEETKKTNDASFSSGNPLTAPVDYIGAAGKAKVTAEKVIDTVSLARHIQTFYASEGRFPTDLQELVAEKYIPSVPPTPRGMKYAYDSATGNLKIVPQ